MQNKVPDGFEAEEGALKVDIRPESSKLEDYDDVPVGKYFYEINTVLFSSRWGHAIPPSTGPSWFHPNG